MRKALIWLLSISGFLYSANVIGQRLEVSDPFLEMRDNTIHITYDILNSTPSDKFTVELVIRDEEGNRINATALTGDVGDMVYGGSGKQIAWDLEVEKIEMNADIYVKVYVKAIPPPEPVEAAPLVDETKESQKLAEDETQEQATQEAAGQTPAPVTGGKQYSRTGLMLQSVAFPGLGLSRYKGGPHWLRGALGYGCIAGSIILNQVAVNTYDGIIDHAGFDAKNTVYEKSLRQDQVSEALAYTAIAIWISDMVWTMVGTSDLNKRSSYQRGFRIHSTIDPVSHTPLLAFNYRF